MEAYFVNVDPTTLYDVKIVVLLAITVTVALQFVVSAILQHNGRKEMGEGLHLARRAQHAATGLLFYALSYTELGYRYRFQGVATLGICSLGVYVIHRWRLSNPAVRDFLAKTYSSILRERELKGGIPGAFFFLLGVSLAGLIMLTMNDDAEGLLAWRLSLLYLSLGDPVAAIMGTLFATPGGKGKKSFIGSLYCFLICAACTYFEDGSEDIVFAIIGGLIGAYAERLDAVADDNLIIPVVSTMALLAWFQRHQLLFFSARPLMDELTNKLIDILAEFAE